MLRRYIVGLGIVAMAQLTAGTVVDTGFMCDFSNQVSMVDRMPIASWEDDAEGFVVSAVGAVDGEALGYSATVVASEYEGQQALEVSFPKGEAAEQWRSIKRTYPSGLNIGDRTLIEYGILSHEGSGRDFVTGIILTGPKGERFSAYAHIIPTLWRGVIFDVSQCRFRNDIRSIEIGLRNEGTQSWDDATFAVDGLCAGLPIDMDFNIKGSSIPFRCIGKGRISEKDGNLRYNFSEGSAIELRVDTSRNMIYNPPLEIRNTVRMVVANNSSADSMRLYFVTQPDQKFEKRMSVASALPKRGMTAVVQFNLSACDGATGHLRGLRMEPLGGSGRLDIDHITFERERPIRDNCGTIISAIADNESITIDGTVDSQWLSANAEAIEIRYCPLYQSDMPIDSLALLAECGCASSFRITDIPNSRLDGKMTHLSSRFAAYLRQSDGRRIPLGDPFFIGNWRDFATNPYAFTIGGSDYRVTDFGATGDGISNDNLAIQATIDKASQAGGGRVILPSGGEYIATDLLLRSNVEMVIESGAVLRQSSRMSDYTSYRPEYGHDNVIPGIPWTHCMYTNMPLILAKDVENVKITGGGTIRMDDTYSENQSWTHYAKYCSDRIHIVPIAVCNTRHVEISDIDIVRCNNYHTIFYRADSVFIGNLKMQEVACVSGDGISIGNAVTNVRVERCVFESNDDGIVLAASYKDPRGGGWRERVDSIDASIRNIKILHSYIDSKCKGGGKAIAFIPWASTNPRLDHNEIDGIEVHDCVLRGGHSVGTWADNPFDGKLFTNEETDDYSPIKNVDITDNEYLSQCDMLWVQSATFVTDCGLHGSSMIKNEDFSDRTAYWTIKGSVGSDTAGVLCLDAGSEISQSLWLVPGEYEIRYRSDTELYVIPGTRFSVDTADTYRIAMVAPAGATVYSVRLIRL